MFKFKIWDDNKPVHKEIAKDLDEMDRKLKCFFASKLRGKK